MIGVVIPEPVREAYGIPRGGALGADDVWEVDGGAQYAMSVGPLGDGPRWVVVARAEDVKAWVEAAK